MRREETGSAEEGGDRAVMRKKQEVLRKDRKCRGMKKQKVLRKKETEVPRKEETGSLEEERDRKYQGRKRQAGRDKKSRRRKRQDGAETDRINNASCVDQFPHHHFRQLSQLESKRQSIQSFGQHIPQFNLAPYSTHF